MLWDLLKTQTVRVPKEAAHPETLQPRFLLDTRWTPTGHPLMTGLTGKQTSTWQVLDLIKPQTHISPAMPRE